MTQHANGTYRNPIYTRGFLVLQDGGMVTARVRGGPLNGLYVGLQHTWTLGRRPVELAGALYALETDPHGFVFRWVQHDAEVMNGTRSSDEREDATGRAGAHGR